MYEHSPDLSFMDIEPSCLCHNFQYRHGATTFVDISLPVADMTNCLTDDVY